MADERREFVAFLGRAGPDECRQYPILPYRRVLSTTEAREWLIALTSIWGKWYGGGTESQNLPPNVTLHQIVMEKTAASYEHLREVLARQGVKRLLELSFETDSCELDLGAASFAYAPTGAEMFWTSGTMDWMVDASHESSITFGGRWLIEAMKAYLQEYDRYIYKGWDLSRYESEGRAIGMEKGNTGP